MSDKPTVVLLKDTIAQSVIKNFAYFAMLTGTIGLGVYLQSSAMQWAGFFLAAITIIGHGMRTLKDNRLTIAQARAKLDEIEKGGA